MSLILEALRKSEAERQRGQAPGLFAAQQAAAKPRRHLPLGMLAMAGVLLAVVLAWGWREWQRDATPIAADSAASVTEATGATGATDPTAPSAVAPAIADPAPPSTPASPATTAADPAAWPSPGLEVATAPAAASLPAQVSAAPARSLDATADPGQAPAPSAPVAAPMPAPASPSTSPIPAATAAMAADVPASPAVTAPPPEPIADQPPPLSQLAASERAQLPPLKLSMHVFTDDPAARFVILDGRRLREGDSPGAGVVVEEIRRDGLVLSVQGQRLWLGRP